MMRQAVSTASKKIRHAPSGKVAAVSVAVEPVVLHEIAPETVAALNAIYRRRVPIDVEIAGEAATIGAVWPAHDDADAASTVVAFSVGGTDGSLSLPFSVVKDFLSKIDPAANASDLSPDRAALLLECLLSDEIDWLEAQFECPIALTSVEKGQRQSRGTALTFTLTIGGHSASCTLALEDRRAVRLGRILDGAQGTAPRARLDLPVNVCIWRAACSLSVDELRSLLPGDVILPEETGLADSFAVAVFADHFMAPLQLTDEGGRLTAGPRSIRGSNWEWIMDHSKRPEAPGIEDSDLEDLPITVIFELARMSMPLKEISQLAPGAVVPIPGLSQETVDILANGKRIGRGEIVRIGDGLGIRIIRISENA
jgi:type III secretion protein Q